MERNPNDENRLRRYAQAFRREATPSPDLPARLLAGLGRRAQRGGPLSLVPAVALAGLVLIAGVVLAFAGLQLRNLAHLSPTPPVSLRPLPTVTPSVTPSLSPSASPTPTPSPTPTAQPGIVSGLAAIQMVGPRLGWAVGSHGIYATSDGAHWRLQYSSGEQFIGVDFISNTTGWAVGTNTLFGTTDGGASWHQLGEASQTIRSVHFVNASQGWGIAGGDELAGARSPNAGAIVVETNDGGYSWHNLAAPADAQSVCFSDATHGWLATGDGIVYRSQDGGRTWNASLQMKRTIAAIGAARIECAAPSALWVDWAPGGAAAGHSPYVVYATVDGSHWRTVMAEPGTIGNELPGVPAGPGSYPGSFSVVDPSDAVFVGDTPPANAATVMLATNGGATLKTTGSIGGAIQTFDAAFVSMSTGWVLAQDTSGQDVIAFTSDGGYHWSTQLAVPR